jgi:hypothetical protein
MAKKEKENQEKINKRKKYKRLRNKLNNKPLPLLNKLKSKKLPLLKEKAEEEEEEKVNNDLFNSITLNLLYLVWKNLQNSLSSNKLIFLICSYRGYCKFIILE